jgi:hypothetical protein
MGWAHNDLRWLKVEKVLAGLMLALFLANVLAWKGVHVFGDDKPFRPLASVYLTAALLLQAVASLARRRSYPLSYLLLGSSFVALWFSLTAR